MKTTYYEATGDLRKQLRYILDRRAAGFRKLKAWAKKNGGKLATSESTWGLKCLVACDEPKSPEHWKLRRRDQPGFWEPKHSTKAGKALAAELETLTKNAAGKREIADAIGLGIIDNSLYIPDVGIKERGNRILLAVKSELFKPSGSLKRISDVQFERSA